MSNAHIAQSGWFPASFVTVVAANRKSEVITSPSAASAEKPRASSTKSDDRKGPDVIATKRNSSVNTPGKVTSPVVPVTPFRKGEQRVVVRKYAAGLPQQLALEVNDIVILTNERNGWFQGKLLDVVTGDTLGSGWFPSMCVASQPLVLAPPSPDATRSPATTETREVASDQQPAAQAETTTSAPVAVTDTVSSIPADSVVQMRKKPQTQNDVQSQQPPDVPFMVKLSKSGSALGVAIAGGKSDKYGDLGIFVNDIIKDSAAERDGRLTKGDQLLEVNGGMCLCVNIPSSVSMSHCSFVARPHTRVGCASSSERG